MRIGWLLTALAIVPVPIVAQTTASLDSLYLKSAHYRHLTGLWAHYKPAKTDVVMLGNSITAGAEWSELLGRPHVINRGIGGDNLVGFRHRMQFVLPLRPKVCFVMGGINDLYAGYTPEQVFRHYVAVLDSLRSAAIIPVVQSTLHVSPRWRLADEKNPQVAALNGLLAEYCRQAGVEYLDLNTRLTEDQRLRDEYTTDGVHLTAAAYAVWAEVLEPVLRRHGL
jgi:lysophospholipase L1-like esterase